MYSTAYIKEQLATGRRKALKVIVHLKPGQTASIDQNNKCFGATADAILVCDLSYQPELVALAGAIRGYSNNLRKTLMILNKPWCRGIDSQKFLSMKDRADRMRAAEALYRFSCIVHKREYEERKQSPLFAFYNFFACCIATHQCLPLATAFAKDVMTNDSINAITESGLRLTPENMDDYPISTSNRRFVRGVCEEQNETDVKRSHKLLNYNAMNLCGNFSGSIDSDDDITALYCNLEALLGMDGHSSFGKRMLDTVLPMLKTRDRPLERAFYKKYKEL
jgi:hypothetical protein